MTSAIKSSVDASMTQSGERSADELEAELRRIIREFITSLAASTARLREAGARRDWVAIRDETHRLKSAGAFGYPLLTERARQIERAGARRNASELAAALDALGNLVRHIECGAVLLD